MNKLLITLLVAPILVFGFGNNFTTTKTDRIENNTQSQITLGSPLVGDTDIVIQDRLEVNSTTEASRPCPSMTNTQRDALTPANGDCIYSTTDNVFNYYNNTVWGEMAGGSDATINNGLLKWNTTTEKSQDSQLIEDADGLLRTTATDYELLTLTDDSFLNKRYLDLNFQPLDGDLTGLSVLSGTGFVVRTAADTYTERSITGTANETEITNGSGAAGDVIVGIVDNPVFSGNESITVPSGTIAQRPTGVAGMIRYNSDDGVFEGYTDDWGSIGAGGLGSAQTITIVQSDDDTVDISGNNPTFDGGGTISGTITQNTTASNFLTGEKSVYFYDASATPQNDYFGFTRDIPQGWRGRTIAYEFTYRTDSVYQNGDIVFHIKDNTNSDLLIVSGQSLDQFSSADGNGETIRGLVNIPVDAASLDFGFQVVGTTASFDFFVDKISLDIDDFNYKNVTEVLSVEAQGNSAQSITIAVTDIPFTEVSDPNNAWDGDSYTVQGQNSVIAISTNTFFTTTANRYLELFKNGSPYKVIGDLTSWTSHRGNFTSTKGEFTTGDVLSIRSQSNGGTLDNTANLHFINITETQPESKHVVVDSGESDTEYFYVNYQSNFWDAATSTDEWDHSLIKDSSGASDPSASSSNFFTISDASGQTRITAKDRITLNVSVTSSMDLNGIVRLHNSSGDILQQAQADASGGYRRTTTTEVTLESGDYLYIENTDPFSDRAGSVTITAQKAQRGEYHLVPVSDQENVYSAVIDLTGTTASIESQNQNAIVSVSRSGAGAGTITVKGGIFTVPPTITISAMDESNISNNTTAIVDQVSFNSSADWTFIYSTRDANAGAGVDTDFSITLNRVGVDYKEQKAFIGTINPDDFVKTPDTRKAVVCSWEHEGNTSVIRKQFGGCLDSCTRTATGAYTCQWTAGYWAEYPNCSWGFKGYNINYRGFVGPITDWETESTWNVQTRNASDVIADRNWMAVCHGIKN